MTHMISRICIAAALGLTSSLAMAEPLTLKSQAVVSADVVTLGDLVNGAGSKAGVALFRAPELGKVGTIRAESIARAMLELGINDFAAHGLSAVVVSRPAKEINSDAIRLAVRKALIKLDGSLSDDAVVNFANEPQSTIIPRDAELSVDVDQFEIERGVFALTVRAGSQAIQLKGVIESRVMVPVLVRAIGRGDVIGPNDYVVEPRSRRSVPAGQLVDPAALPSLVAKRALKTGQLVAAADMSGRDLVERNQKVTIVYQQPGITLSLTGKAVTSGAQGAVVQVQNVSSKRTFDAVVTGPATVSAKLTP